MAIDFEVSKDILFTEIDKLSYTRIRQIEFIIFSLTITLSEVRIIHVIVNRQMWRNGRRTTLRG